MQFYDIMHNTAYKRGMPEIYEIVKGLEDDGPCPACGIDRCSPSGDIQVQLGDSRARLWPDLIACGDYPLFVMSEVFVNAMRDTGVRLELGGRVDFLNPSDTGLSPDDAPQYFWLDGTSCRAATMDFDASGYVDVRFCPDCGVFSSDISLTHRRQHADPPPGTVFDYDEFSGFDLFTTDLGPTAFYCTDRVLDCAKKHKLTNVAFRPVEEGEIAEPLKY